MTQESVITQKMRDAIGVDSEALTYDVEKGAAKKFAEAIGDDNPLYVNEEVAKKSRYGSLITPPTFMRSMSAGRSNVTVESPYSASLDGGSEWEYFEPIRPGDRITVTNKVSDMFEREGRLGNMLFIVRETTYVNQSDKKVAIQRSTGISYKPSD